LEELAQLTTNMTCRFKLPLSFEAIEVKLKSLLRERFDSDLNEVKAQRAPDPMEATPWDQATFAAWFSEAFVEPPAQPQA